MPDRPVGQAGGRRRRGPAALRRILGETRVFEREVSIGQAGPEFLPRLWATKEVGFLLDQIRLHGEGDELVDEIVSLSRRHGIITPYTSFLIVEDDLPAPIAEGTGLRDGFWEDSEYDEARETHIYCQLQTGGTRLMRKMVLMK